MKPFFNLLFIVSFVFLSCTQPRIDTSSDERMKESIEKVRNSLGDDERKKFDEALQAIASSQITIEGLFQQGLTGVGSFQAKTKEALNGKTATEVIEAGREIYKQKISELEAKKSAAEKDRLELQKFKVVRARFSKRSGFLHEEAIINLSVINETNIAVSHAYFVGTLSSPGRSVPWHKGEFNYQISGGLEPGEKASWTLKLNLFSGWVGIDAPKDAAFSVEVVRLDGPNGKVAFSTSQFSENEEKQLDELKQKHSLGTP